MLPNKTNPRVIVSYHRAIPPKNFIPNFVPGIKWFRKRMCVLVGQKCPILISYSGNEQPFRQGNLKKKIHELIVQHVLPIKHLR